MKNNKANLENCSKDELTEMINQMEDKFADSNALAAELVVELEEKNSQLRSTQEMLEKMAFIGELAAGVGHEINNPLTICIGKLDQLRDELVQNGAMTPEIQEMLSVQSLAFERISLVVEGLRNYSHNSTSKVDAIDIHEAILSTVKLTGSMYAKTGIDISLDLRASEKVVRGSFGKIQQVVINFLTNARDALEETEDKRISISTRSENSNIVLTIKDNGCGIAHSIKDKVFENFFTTKPIGKGTGMGLNISGKIINEMAGSIEIGPDSESGAEFVITLPTIEQPATANEKKAQATPTSDQQKFSGKVLVVDDEVHIREILSRFLIFFGFEVSQAENGVEGIEAIKSETFDIVFSDMTMPKMTGDVFARKAKQIVPPECKIYILTGGVTDCSPESADTLDSVVDGFLTKPFDKNDIFEFLREESKILLA